MNVLGATGLWLTITSVAVALLGPFFERWVNARIDSAVEQGLKRKLATYQLEVLARGKTIADETDDVWIFPSPRDADEPLTRHEAADFWRAVADAVGIKEGSRIGAHSFRRSFANRLRDVPLKELTTI